MPTAPLNADQVARVRRLVDDLGDRGAAAELGVHRSTAARAAAGLALRPAVLSAIGAWLRAAEASADLAPRASDAPEATP